MQVVILDDQEGTCQVFQKIQNITNRFFCQNQTRTHSFFCFQVVFEIINSCTHEEKPNELVPICFNRLFLFAYEKIQGRN